MNRSLPTDTWRAMLVLALPVLAEESLNLLVGYTDFFLAGRYLAGKDALAAMGLVAYILWILPTLFSFVSIGALALVARLVGAGDRPQAAHATRQALVVGIVFAGAGIFLSVTAGSWFVRAMNLQGEAATLAIRYLWILTPAIPLIMLEQVGTACLRAAGDTVSGLVARVVVNIANLTISTVLVLGLGPFPQLGWDGLAIGTTCGHVLGGAIILGRLIQGGGGVSIARGSESRGLAAFGPDWALIRRMLRVGLPGGMDIVAVLICHLFYVAIINRLGTLAQAAHGLGVQIEAMSYLPGSAFQVAAATLAGQALGAADPRRARRAVLYCVASATSIMCVAGLVMYFAGEQLAALFTGGPTETSILVGQLLKIVAWSCPPLAILIVTSGALRGSGDTTWPLAITLIGLAGIRIPGACLLAWDEIPLPGLDMSIPGLGLGVAGAWWAMVVDVSLRSILIAGRFLHGGWQRAKV
jgi:putative MATE family efflux protein